MNKADRKIKALRELGLTEAEIHQVIIDDNRIDKGEKMFQLTEEQEKVSKEARQIKRKPTVYKLDNTAGKRSRKKNATKATIIAELAKFLEESQVVDCENVEVTNKERQITFSMGGNRYELTLVQKRK